MSEDELRVMTSDEYINYILESGKYDVDIHTGAVTHVSSGRTRNCAINTSGYLVVGLVYNRKLVRQAKVHRMVAIKGYGLNAVVGKHIAHLDSNKINNDISNLRPMDAPEHVKYDGTDHNLTHRNLPKISWSPCAHCGDPNGRGKVTPDRISGKRFGISGQICRKCYGMFQERERRRKH